MSEPAVASVTIDLADQDAMRLWRTVAAVATQLGGDDRWCLIGGQRRSPVDVPGDSEAGA